MISLNASVFAVLLGLSVAAVVMIVSSFIVWMNTWETKTGETYHWKWMVVVTMLVALIILLPLGASK